MGEKVSTATKLALAWRFIEPAPSGMLEAAQADADKSYSRLQSTAGRRQLSVDLGGTIAEPNWQAAADQMSRLASLNVAVISRWDRDYPKTLLDVSEAPDLLFYRGDLSVMGDSGVAIVGARKPTASGIKLARELAADLGASGVTVISGLARGIDTAAHLGCLSANAPTVAVIGTGLDVPYPTENASLAMEIARTGVVVSEQLLGTPPLAHVFPRRNRIISGLAQMAVIVQGGGRSGSLITARWALEQGREVGAVPGFPGDYRSTGVNRLLRQGAHLVESASDVLTACPRLTARLVARVSADTADDPILLALGGDAVTLDELAQTLSLSPAETQRSLLELEMAGQISRDATGRYRRT